MIDPLLALLMGKFSLLGSWQRTSRGLRDRFVFLSNAKTTAYSSTQDKGFSVAYIAGAPVRSP